MKTWITRLGLIVATGALAVTAASADHKTPGKATKKASAPMCSVCKMPLAAKKSKTNTVAVKVGKKTYYCCDKCPMGKK